MIVVIVCLMLWSACCGHWLCSNGNSPGVPNPPHNFCSMYNDASCCSTQEELKISSDARHFMELLGSDACKLYMNSLVCAKCSPWSGHAFDGKRSVPTRLPLPNLCTGACHDIMNKCPQFFDTLVIPGVAFTCDSLQYGPSTDCYPKLEVEGEHEGNSEQHDHHEKSKLGCVCAQEFAGNLRNPLLARPAFDGSGRIFVLEQSGIIKIFDESGKMKEEPFVDMNSFEGFLPPQYKADERGLLGLAFHPGFKENGKLYIYYSCHIDHILSNDMLMCVAITEFKIDESNPNKLNVSSARNLFTIYEPYVNHNGGEMIFDDDGYLLLFVGDGGNQGDPLNNGQRKDTFLGKVLRVDVDTRYYEFPYGIPKDNPFVNDSRFLPEIYAYGVRNIWRCGKDRGQAETGEGKGRIICGDVGQNKWELLRLIKKGANYGWSAFEGSHCYKQEFCDSVGAVEKPIYEYPHTVGKSVTGGLFYRGCRNSHLDGVYIYGDFDSGKLYGLVEDDDSSKWQNHALPMCESCGSGLTNSMQRYILSFGEDEHGEIYVLTSDKLDASKRVSLSTGKIYKLIHPHSKSSCA